MTLPVTLRAPTADDLAFILHSWLETNREEGANRHMPNEVYYAIHKQRIIDLLQRASVIVAVNPADEWQIYGWLAYEPGVLHYVYTKRPFRHGKVASRLFEAANVKLEPWRATHTGWAFDALRALWGLTYDPR